MFKSRLEKEIKKLEDKLCCKTRYYDTFEDFPETGTSEVLYIDEENGGIYIWNGEEYISVGGGGNNDMYLFQVGVPGSGHIHYAALSKTDAQDLIHETNSVIPVADEIQPSVIITTESNGNPGDEHIHDLTIHFDYVNHTFIVTDITNNDLDNHEAHLVGGGSSAPVHFQQYQAIPYTGTELPIFPGVNLWDTITVGFSDGNVVNYSWDGFEWLVDFVEGVPTHTHTLSDISDYVAPTPYTHPNHSGDVTSLGDGATTLAATAISGKGSHTTIVGSEEFLINDGGTLKKATASSLASYIAPGLDPIANLRVNTQAPSTSTFSITVPTNRDYHMLPRLCINPTNGVLTQIFRSGTGHVGAGDFGVAVLRRSLDRGKTWHGINPGDTHTVIRSEANIDLRNYGVFYTNTGRLIFMYARYTGTSWAGMDSRYMYSDDDGVTWSSPAILPSSDTTTAGLIPTHPYSNKCVYDASGAMIYAFYEYPTTNQGRVKLGRSTDNGVTWNMSYSTAILDTTAYIAEPVLEDFGDGLFLCVVRRVGDTTGFFYPFIMRSLDYGQNWAGGSQTLSIADVNSSLHGSGNLPVEGPGVIVGASTTSCIPDLAKMVYKGSQYLIIPYHVRVATGLFNVLRMTVLNLDDYLATGLSELEDISITIYQGTNNGAGNPNGGNTSIVVFGNEMLIATGNQTTTSSSGTQNIVTLYVRANTTTALIEDYLALK